MNLSHQLRQTMRAATIAKRAVALGASQQKYELQKALEVVIDAMPQTMLEIGCDRGGTLYAWGQVCPEVYGITLPENRDSGGAGCDPHGAVMFYGDSHSQEAYEWTLNRLGGGDLDILVIDGDHRGKGVRQDLADYGSLVRQGGLIMIHDVLSDKFPAVEVWKVWAEIRGLYDTYVVGAAFGWGIIHVQDGDDFRR